MNSLPIDVLEGIMGKVDKYEHLKMLLANFTEEEMPKLNEIINEAISRKKEILQDKFHEIKEVYKQMLKNNRKKNAKQQRLVVDLEHKGNIHKVKITNMAIKWATGISITNNFDKITTWRMCNMCNVKKYYFEDVEDVE